MMLCLRPHHVPQRAAGGDGIEREAGNHLVSRYTSLVAVDITPTRPVDMPGSELGQPIHLARAQDLAALPKTAVGWQLQILLGVTALMLAAWLRGLQRDAA